MIIKRFFGGILILLGGLFLLISGGCTLAGGAIILSIITKGEFDQINDFVPVGLVTLTTLAISIGIVKGGYALCKKDKLDCGEKYNYKNSDIDSYDLEGDITSDSGADSD